jgi:hypothetical protein
LGSGDAFFITSGNTGAGETYVCNTTGTIVFGTTAINFVQVSSTQIYAGGNGITISGPTISLQAPVTVANGGTGLTTAPTDGQLLTGNGTGYSLNTLKAGTGISVANAPGSITISATSADGPILESEITISENYTISTGKNGLSVGPVTIASGYNVTVPAGQTWVVLNQASGSGAGTIATVGKAIAMSIVFGG